jgi:phosphoglycerol transferase
MEQALPDGAMVFQTPIMDFPESPAPGVTSYDHFRPFLYSRDLRFSFGSDKGRPDGDWQHQFTQLSLPEVVAQLESAGFSAIYVNRSGFANQGADLVKAFQSAGLTDIINSERGDLFCVVLRKR